MAGPRWKFGTLFPILSSEVYQRTGSGSKAKNKKKKQHVHSFILRNTHYTELLSGLKIAVFVINLK